MVVESPGSENSASDEQLDWDDEGLFVRENRRRRTYRRLQSWYRQERLGAPYGLMTARRPTAKRPAVPARPVGSLIDPAWAADNPGANFLPSSGFSDAILAYVARREVEVRAAGGSLDPVRLRTNLLSSMPLCFNLFGALRAEPRSAAELLRRAFDLDIVGLTQVAGIDGIECEWAPPRAAGIGDRTAFDAVVAYHDGDGRTCLLGVETKYTESFSTTQYGRPNDPKQARRRTSYARWTRSGWFRPGAEDRLYRPATNQLWRNVMLGAACQELPDVDRVDVAVVALHRDPHAIPALAGIRAELEDPTILLDASLERICRLARGGPFHEWAVAFEERYIDLGPVARAGLGDRDALQ